MYNAYERVWFGDGIRGIRSPFAAVADRACKYAYGVYHRLAQLWSTGEEEKKTNKRLTRWTMSVFFETRAPEKTENASRSNNLLSRERVGTPA